MKELSYEGLEKEKSEIAFYLLKEGIKENKILDFEVVGNSMSPLLEIGDKISIRNIGPCELKRGDIIVYKKNNHLFAHRYIYPIRCLFNRNYQSQKEDNSFKFITKGDNASNFDKWLVSPKELFGKVISIKKNYGEINLESFLWKINNYLIAWGSYLQVSVIEFCKRIKKCLVGNKKLYFTPLIKKPIFFSLSGSLKSVVYTLILASRLIHPKHTKIRQ